ncbi:hypothetical protein [Bradyrhizobium elkanii]|uniref:hypothetical protein n=1 Tax=Bradyrhizobium elkanii TaxID=29448 RepID=UPI0004B8E5C7|nr:hypothetical protein [Bradyrhizobium elkanii]WLA84817.1 hypothetical protein QNJ99_11480 [Bradyrhizobium elkanii]
MAFRRDDDPQFRQALKKALAGLIADGIYVQPLRKWNMPVTPRFSSQWVNGEP